MLNLDREIRPEDFAIDPNRVYYPENPVSVAIYKQYHQEKEELKRLYHLQEEAKAKAHFKRERARKGTDFIFAGSGG